jgi:hypothetical protein
MYSSKVHIDLEEHKPKMSMREARPLAPPPRKKVQGRFGCMVSVSIQHFFNELYYRLVNIYFNRAIRCNLVFLVATSTFHLSRKLTLTATSLAHRSRIIPQNSTASSLRILFSRCHRQQWRRSWVQLARNTNERVAWHDYSGRAQQELQS